MLSIEGVNQQITIWGLSSDEKPTGKNVPNGSLFICMDSKSIFVYDAENKRWIAW